MGTESVSIMKKATGWFVTDRNSKEGGKPHTEEEMHSETALFTKCRLSGLLGLLDLILQKPPSFARTRHVRSVPHRISSVANSLDVDEMMEDA